MEARRLIALGTAFLLLGGPVATADIIPNEPESGAPDQGAAAVVKERLLKLGVGHGEADRILSSLTPDEVDYFHAHPNANAVVGQEEIITMFWYEWAFALAYAYMTWLWWDEFGWCRAFFPGCD